MSKQYKKCNEEKEGITAHHLKLRLSELQRKAKAKQIPMIIVFEGVNASGKAPLINELILTLDPRHVKVHAHEEVHMRPFMWSSWNNIPRYGDTAIFYKSWYSSVILKGTKHRYDEEKLENYYEYINSFEKELFYDGYLIIKILLDVDEKVYKQRLGKMKSNSLTSWKAQKYKKENYKEYKKMALTVLENTNTEYCPWNIIKSNEGEEASIEVLELIIASLEHAISKVESITYKALEGNREGSLDVPNVLGEGYIYEDTCKDEFKNKIKIYQKKLKELQYQLYKQGVSLIVVYEGWDAAGKGGNIRRVIKKLDPTIYEVHSTAAPSDIEKVHHYLWRFWTRMPKTGHIAIFDRSWYGRVLVERIEGFCGDAEWKRAYNEINEMEEQLVHSNSIVIKFWLDIDNEEQLKRFKAREQNPNKQWKITEEDWRNREKWELYSEAVNEMIYKTNRSNAPWIILNANCKPYARLKALSTIIELVQSRLKKI